MTPHLIAVGARKGGVGKTFLSRLLLSYFEKRPQGALHARVFDGEAPDGILKRFHAEAEIVDVRNSDDQVKIFDGLKSRPVTLLDLPAGELDYLLETTGTLGFLDDVRRGSLQMTVFHVLGTTQASIDEISSVKRRVAGARHFLVTNHINESSFAVLTDELRAAADGVVDIPQLNALAAQHVDQQGVGFNAFIANEHNSLVLRRYVAAWQEKCFAQLELAH